MSKVLFPTDFTATSRQALDYALTIARNKGISITLLHIYDLEWPDYRYTKEELRYAIEQKEAEIMRRYKAFTKHLPENINTEMMIRRGQLVGQIIRYAREEQFSFVVIDGNTQRGIREWLFGSNIEAIVDKVASPVLTITDKKPFKGIKSFIHATNFVSDNIMSLQEIDNFARLFKAQITFLKISTTPITNQKRERASQYEIGLNKLLQSPFKVVLVEHQSVAQGIMEYTKKHKGDLVTILKRYRNFAEKMFYDSLTQKLLSTSDIPILVFQQPI